MVRTLWVGVVLGLAGCPESVPPATDEQAPSTRAYAITPSGTELAFVDGALLVPTSTLLVRIEADEAATVYYTTDGAEPTRQGAGVARNAVALTLDTDTTVRWFAEDLAGNAGPPGRVEVRFDREAPEADVMPNGGSFSGFVEVVVRPSEPVAIWWSTNGVAPSPGRPNTEAGEAAPDLPLRLRLTESTTLRVLMQDPAGNAVFLESVDFEIDGDAPVTHVEPPEGDYVAPVEVRLSTDDPTATIHYTLDGTAPGAESPVYNQPFVVAETTTVQVSAVDAGGNAEIPQTVRYRIGTRAPGPPEVASDGLNFPVEGGLWLAASLLEAAGPLAGADGPVFGADWAAWAMGRDAIDATVFQGGLGLHASRATSVAQAAGAPDAPADANNNGSALDETWAARVARFGSAAGAVVPQGIHPTALFYVQANAAFSRPLWDGLRPDGLPRSEDDFTRLRWEGARGGDREVTPGASAAGLRALVARARAGTAGRHRPGAGGLASVEPVVSLRCGGCHRAGGAEPQLTEMSDYFSAGLVVPGDVGSPLLGLLSGTLPHFGDAAVPTRVAAVRAWIEAGAQVGPGEESPAVVGTEGREGLLGLLAAETAGRGLEVLAEDFFFSPQNRRLVAAGTGAGTYVAARVAVTEGEGGTDLPRTLDTLTVRGPTFDTRGHARLARALHDAVKLGVDRPEVFEIGTLSGDEALPAIAARLLPIVLDALITHGLRTEGGFEAQPNPGEPDGDLDALATAEAAMALLIGGRSAEAQAALRALETLVDAQGDVRTRGAAEAAGDRPLLAVQLTALEAFARAAADGDATSMRSAQALWTRLETGWWDAQAEIWQSTLGLADSAWTPDLAARAVDALRAAHRMGLPEAEARLATLVERVVRGGLLVAETWRSGEHSGDGDSDHDGVPGVGALAPDGAAPVFYRLITF